MSDWRLTDEEMWAVCSCCYCTHDSRAIADAASEKAHRAGVAEGRAQSLLSIAEDDDLLEVGRKAVETALVEWRDSRLFEFPRGNGLVIRERDGKDSSMIRFGPEMGIRIGLKAIAQHLISLGIPRPGGEG